MRGSAADVSPHGSPLSLEAFSFCCCLHESSESPATLDTTPGAAAGWDWMRCDDDACDDATTAFGSADYAGSAPAGFVRFGRSLTAHLAGDDYSSMGDYYMGDYRVVDWSIILSNTSHLVLVNSVIEDVQVGVFEALVQCDSCDSVTLKNVSIRGIRSSTLEFRTAGTIQITSSTLISVDIHDVRCENVMGSMRSACLSVDLQPGGRVRISDSYFGNNHVHGMRRGDTYDDQTAVGGAVLLSLPTPVNERSVASILVERTVFTDNGGGCGAGLAIVSTNSWLPGSAARSNSSGSSGSRTGVVTVDLCNSTFYNNSAMIDGGGLYIRATSAALNLRNGTLMTRNAALGRHGGAIALYSRDVEVVSIIDGSTISHNAAAGHGGGVFVQVHDMNLDGSMPDVMDDYSVYSLDADAVSSGILDRGVVIGSMSVFEHNRADRSGGAIHIGAARIDSPISIHEGSVFRHNTARINGGAIYVAKNVPNHGVHVSGGSYLYNNSAVARGGFLYIQTPLWPRVNSTILIESAGTVASSNSALTGGFIYVFSDYRQAMWLTVADGCLISDNTATQDGGAIMIVNSYSAGVSITRGARMESNRAGFSGGALYIHVRKWLGIYVTDGAGVSGNVAGTGGGAVYVDKSSPYGWPMVSVRIQNGSGVSNNTAEDGDGGGFCMNVGEGLEQFHVMDGAALDGNRAGGRGGGLYVSAPWEPSSCVDMLWDRSSSLSHNTAYQSGGGIFVESSDVQVRISGASEWRNNTSLTGSGGAMYAHKIVFNLHGLNPNNNDLLNDFNTASDETASTVSLARSGVLGNRAAVSGGAFYFEGGKTTWLNASDDSEISRNTAEQDGGAVYFENSNSVGVVGVHLDGSTCVGNSAGVRGGGFYFGGGRVSSVDVLNCTVANNRARYADGGVFYIGSPHWGISNGRKVFAWTKGGVSVDVGRPDVDDDGPAWPLRIIIPEHAVHLRDTRFINNTALGAGGVLALVLVQQVARVDVGVAACTFLRNTAGSPAAELSFSQSMGGALVVWQQQQQQAAATAALGCDGCVVSVTDTSFVGNMCAGAGMGGAMMVAACCLRVFNCAFTGNHATRGGGALAGMQTALAPTTLGLWPMDMYSNPTTNMTTLEPPAGESGWQVDVGGCTFVNNTSEMDLLGGGAVHLYAAAVHHLDTNIESNRTMVSITDCSFRGNVAAFGSGGALFVAAMGRVVRRNTTRNVSMMNNESMQVVAGTRVLLERLVFERNMALRGSAGAMYALVGEGAGVDIVQCRLVDCWAADHGGAAVLDSRGSSSRVSVSNMIAERNHASRGNGGAIRILRQVGASDCSYCYNEEKTSSRFADNAASAGYGGAVSIESACACGGGVVFREVAMERNCAGQSGGAMFVDYSKKSATTRDNVWASSLFGPAPPAFETPSTVCTLSTHTKALPMWVVTIMNVSAKSNWAGRRGAGVYVTSVSVAFVDAPALSVISTSNRVGVVCNSSSPGV